MGCLPSKDNTTAELVQSPAPSTPDPASSSSVSDTNVPRPCIHVIHLLLSEDCVEERQRIGECLDVLRTIDQSGVDSRLVVARDLMQLRSKLSDEMGVESSHQIVIIINSHGRGDLGNLLDEITFPASTNYVTANEFFFGRHPYPGLVDLVRTSKRKVCVIAAQCEGKVFIQSIDVKALPSNLTLEGLSSGETSSFEVGSKDYLQARHIQLEKHIRLRCLDIALQH